VPIATRASTRLKKPARLIKSSTNSALNALPAISF